MFIENSRIDNFNKIKPCESGPGRQENREVKWYNPPFLVGEDQGQSQPRSRLAISGAVE
jgi:hypothetical protein